MNCDTILGLDLARMIAFHRGARCARRHSRCATAAILMPTAESKSTAADGFAGCACCAVVRAASSTTIPPQLDPTVAAALKPYMYCGVLVCEPAVLGMLPPTPPFSLMGDVFAPIAARGMPLCGYVDNSFFRTVDDLASYAALRAEFAATPPPLAYLPR